MMKCPGCSAFCFITAPTPSQPHTLTTVKFPYERELCLLLPGLAWVVSIVYHDILNITLS